MAAGGTDRNPIEVLSEEFLERIRRGEAVTPEDYAGEHPELAEEILALFPALLMMEDLGDETSDRTSSIAGETGPNVGATGGRLGEFRLLREVGRGGMGVVYEAEQESLGRRVALKVLPTGALTDAKQVRRFEREARSAARLHHTNIVPIFGVGECQGTHYYVMQFIQGQGLDAVLGELKKLRDGRAARAVRTAPPGPTDPGHAAADIARSLVTGRFVAGAGDPASPEGASATAAWSAAATPIGPTSAPHPDASGAGASGTSGVSTLAETDRRFAQAVARIGVQVAEALAHAHGQGILHRDIKPSNLLLDREGNVWVTDFGLAKATGTEDLTLTGDIIGTVRYMAPERFEGAGDARADVYALGLTLYELLALRPAFHETDRASLIRQVTQEDPPRLRRLNRHVPLDLETIIHKAIARDPGRRYQTARAFSDDLQRFVDGRPILARRVSTTERLYRWGRRNPALAASLGLFALLLVATTAGSIVAAARFRNIAQSARIAAKDADEARKQADTARRLAESRRIDADAQRQRAQASLAESQASLALARKAVDDSFTRISESALLNVPGLRPLRRDLLESALAFYEEFLRRGGDESATLADLAATQARVGQVLSDLGAQDKARVALRRAAELHDKVLAARPDDVALLERQSEVWHRLGDLDYRTDKATANAAYRKAIAIRERLAAAHPAEPRFRLALSRSLNGLAISTDADAEVRDAYRRSLELRLTLADEIPEDPDLLHGLSESFLNMGVVLGNDGHREEAVELTTHAIDYGRAGVARRPHDLEFASDLAVAYSSGAAFVWQLGRHDEALALSAEGIAFLRKLSAGNPDVPAYRDALANALGAHGQFLRQVGRTDEALSSGRQAAEILETKPDPDAGALATAAFYRVRLAGLLAGDAAAREFSSWPEPARREADLAIADLRAAVARGFRRADVVRGDKVFKSLATRDDVKSLLAEMERPAAKTSLTKAETPATTTRAPSPLDQPGRLDEDRILGELTIGLVSEDAGAPDRARARLEAMLERIAARRKSGPDSPGLEPFAQSIQLRLGEHLWKDGKLAEARRLWDDVLAPMRRRPADDRGRQAILIRFAPALRRISDLFMESGLWERAAEYDVSYRAGDPEARLFRCYESGLLALARGDVAAYREIASEAVERAADRGDFWIFNALRTATLGPESPVAPERLVEMARRLVAKGRDTEWDWWYRIVLGDALSRAGRDQEALAAIGEWCSTLNGKAVVARIHARAGRAEQARRWLRALERDVDEHVRRGLLAFGALRQPQYWAADVLRTDLLRRQAYALLGETAPELRSLRLMRGEALWRLGERGEAEAELAAAIARAPDAVAALIDRAGAFEAMGARDRADADLAEAARRKPDDSRTWVGRGRMLAGRGDGPGADVAYARAAGLAPGRLDPFLEPGWWVAGPYAEDMNRPQPPEEDPDPSRPVASETGPPLRWRPARVNEDRYLLLGPFAGRPRSSVYAMTHLASDRERTAMLCLSGGDRVRVWLNGRLVFDGDQPHTYHFGPEFLAPVTLRAGRNTLLARVSHGSGGHRLRLRAEDFELDRAYFFAEFGRWSDAADLFDRAEQRGQFLHPWPKARQVELLAALGDRDRYLRTAAGLADFDGPVHPDPFDVALGVGMMPNTLISSDRLIEVASQGVALKPAETWRKIPLGLAYYRAGRHREALDHLTRHIADAHYLEAPILAMAHWRLGENDEARKALARTDDHFASWCRERWGGRGTAWIAWWYDGPRLVALRREAHALIDGHSRDDQAALAKVRADMGHLIDDRDSPTWAYDLALRLEPGNAGYSRSLAARLIELGRPAEAEPALAAMVEGKADAPPAWIERGTLLAEARAPDRAAADFARALERLPEDFDIWGSRAATCSMMAAHPAAYERLLTLRPSDALLWYVRAEKHLARHEYQAAVADFARGGEPPATTEFAYIYAAALLLAGDESGYRDYVIRLADQYGDAGEPFTQFVLARLAALADRPAIPPDRIVEWARRAAAAQPRFAWYAHVQALAFVRAGDDEAATRSLELSKSLGWTGGGQALNDLVAAMIQRRQGHARLALEPFERIRTVFDRVPSFHVDSDVVLTDWLEFQVLRSQIEGPLRDAVFPVDPFVR